MPKIQALYSRVSTDMQRDKGFSIPRQKEWLEEEAKRHSFRNPIHYTDNGYSAKDTNRPALNRLLSDIKSDKVDTLVVYKYDRLARNLKDLIELLALLNKHEVNFISINERFDTTTAMGKAMLNVTGTFSQLERDTTVERVTDAMWSKAEKGDFCGGQAPYGYDVKEKCLVINPKEAEVIRLIYNSFEDDPFFRGVTCKLNALGYRTKRGTTFAQSTIKRLLTNVVYIGKQSYGKRSGGSKVIRKDASVFQARHEAIIAEEQFNRVQFLIKNKRHERRQLRHNAVFILSGLMRCECGGSLNGYSQVKKSSGKVYHYYKCHNATSKGTCKGNTYPKDKIENYVLEELRQKAKLKFEEQEAKELPKKNPQDHLKRIDNAIRDLKQKRGRLIDALADGSLPKDIVVNKMDKLTLELEDIENQRQILVAESDPKEKRERGEVLERVNGLNGDIFTMPDLDKKVIMRQLIKGVEVSRAGDVEIELYEL